MALSEDSLVRGGGEANVLESMAARTTRPGPRGYIGSVSLISVSFNQASLTYRLTSRTDTVPESGVPIPTESRFKTRYLPMSNRWKASAGTGTRRLRSLTEHWKSLIIASAVPT